MTARTVVVDGAPLAGATVTMPGTVEVAAPGAARVQWILDGSYLGVDESAPFEWPLSASEFEHELKARIYEADGSKTRIEAEFHVASDATEPISPAPTPTDPALPAPPPPTDPPGDAVTVRDTAELVAALSVARPGTRIQLADGVYSAKNSFTVSTACTAADPCALRGSRAAVLDGDGISGHYGLHLIGASHWTLEGFTVANASKGIMLDGSSRNVIDGVEVRDIGDEAIHLRGFSSDNVVRDNLVRDTGKRVPGYGEGIYVGSAKSNWDRYSGGQPDASDRNVVTGNTIWATSRATGG